MNDNIRVGLSYSDVLLVPQRSPVDTRTDVDLTAQLTESIELDTPLVSAPMDTVTEAEMAIEMSNQGGIGVIHRFMTPEAQAEQVRTVKDVGERVAATVGVSDGFLNRVNALVGAGVDAVVMDIAHGHMTRCLTAVRQIRDEFPDIELIAGNVATEDGVIDLANAGADAVKVGIGPGSHCTTRKVAGAGVPQFTAVQECSTVDVPVIADGGIRTPGDAVKALMAGADTVMMGGEFAGTDEAPGEVVTHNGTTYKRSRGMATSEANEERSDRDAELSTTDEGVAGLTEHTGPVADVIDEYTGGIKSGLSYCGGHTIPEARSNAEFIRQTASAQQREGLHGDHYLEDE